VSRRRTAAGKTCQEDWQYKPERHFHSHYYELLDRAGQAAAESKTQSLWS
jgi:hypothetical protein